MYVLSLTLVTEPTPKSRKKPLLTLLIQAILTIIDLAKTLIKFHAVYKFTNINLLNNMDENNTIHTTSIIDSY